MAVERYEGESENDVYLFPASYGQGRLWFVEQLRPGSTAYIIAATLHLRGPLVVSALADALAGVVARHESLRTTFRAVDGQPYQVISPHLDVPLPVEDLHALAPDARAVRAAQAATALTGVPFDLAVGPLVRARLLRLGADEHTLLLSIHHLIADEWSLSVLLHELSALYSAQVTGEPDGLAPLPIQYADYAEWQRERLSGAALEADLAWWREALAGAPRVLALPTDQARPAAPSGRGAHARFVLPAAARTGLATLGQEAGATLFMTLLAGYGALLGRYSGQEEVLVGSPIAGRTRSEVEGLIGFFVNTLALRVDLRGDPTFGELVGRVRAVTLGAYGRQDLPFERLVEELRPPRDLSRSPLVQVMFVMQNASAWKASFRGLDVKVWPATPPSAKFDLTLYVMETEAGLAGTCEYSTDLFEAESIDRLLADLRSLLERAVAHPDRRLSALFAPAEVRARIATPVRAGDLPLPVEAPVSGYPRDRTIQELFEEQVARAPDAVAVACGEERLSYGALNARANRLAHNLRGRGVGPEAVVGVFQDRSLDLIISLLAILKAGGAYLPLDTQYPSARLAYMLRDSRPALVLARRGLLGAVPPTDVPILAMEQAEALVALQPTTNPRACTRPLNLAYINYTSGSSGRPKGVGTVHRAVVRLVRDTSYLAFSPTDVFLQFSPISFDAATFEIWGPLLNGGRLVIFPPYLPSLAELGDEVRRHGVTTLWLTAGLFHEMVDAQAAGLRGLRYLLAGGDVLSAPHVRRALMRLPACTIINGYGPTENTTFTTCYPVTDPTQVNGTVPIGRAISNTRVYVLDEAMRPAPDGTPGELYIGGDGLARGYLNLPDRTAERFVPDPFGAEPGGRLYRSGDLVRRLPSGDLEFLGRLDRQVKLRGFRVEMGEIEAVLREQPGVRGAAVQAREDRPGEKRLVAYLVVEPPQEAVIEACRAAVRERLPDYMAPASYVCLDALPLTAEGKLDRRALPAPDRAESSPTRRYVAPETPLQRQLATLWEEALNVRPIGIRDDFFDLGGHSLLAVRLLSRVEAECGRRLPLTTLFGDPTIEHMALALTQEARIDRYSVLTPISPERPRPALFFVHGDRLHNGMYCVHLARALGPEQPFYVLHNGQDVPETVEEMAREHVKTLRAIQPHGPYRVGGFCAGGVVAFAIAGQLRSQGQEVDLVALVESQRHDVLYPRLHHLLHRLGLVLGLDARARQRLSVSARYYTGRCHYYTARLRAISRRHASEQLNWMLRQARKSARRLAARRRGGQGLNQSGFSGEPPEKKQAVQALMRYTPQPYAGRVALFWGGGKTVEHLEGSVTGWEGATEDWRAVARTIEVHIIPGTHGSVITTHLPDLADRLKEALARVDRRSSRARGSSLRAAGSSSAEGTGPV